jgi:hypothetical protein
MRLTPGGDGWATCTIGALAEDGDSVAAHSGAEAAAEHQS